MHFLNNEIHLCTNTEWRDVMASILFMVVEPNSYCTITKIPNIHICKSKCNESWFTSTRMLAEYQEKHNKKGKEFACSLWDMDSCVIFCIKMENGALIFSKLYLRIIWPLYHLFEYLDLTYIVRPSNSTASNLVEM